MKNDDEKIELKWWEVKQGLTPYLKKKALEKKANKHAARKAAAAGASNAGSASNKFPASEEKKSSVKEKSRSDNKSAKNKSFNNKSSDIKTSASGKSRKPLDSLFEVNKIPSDAAKLLEDFDSVISSTHPLNSKQRAQLPGIIRTLSHKLTDERGDRRLGYMNSPEFLMAYVHYFMQWNLVRLTRLFANLSPDFFNLKDGDVCLDAGSGPLTLVTALFMARPELRKLKLTWYCMDISQGALSLGENIFLSTAAALHCEAWNIVRVKGEFGSTIKEKVSLFASANMFNEVVQDFEMPPDYLAKKYAEKILSYTKEESGILLVEPGFPKAARFISLLRDAFLRRKCYMISPCTHCEECPMDGKPGGKWCNYAFSTDNAPKKLRTLSEKSSLPKERAVLSFIACRRSQKDESLNEECDLKKLEFRIASDPIRLPKNKTGYYACSSEGLLLIESGQTLLSGDHISIPYPKRPMHEDWKSGAKIVYLD
ncbi:small ribosomal subunit Rsm22 family protein [Treponema sp.]|uniref:small ribosomal subunit Rsm22 family protein n=1 Tax=Treponema sp. TaxID=166 RepID=UPI0025E03E27|nr:small ribosomal subunit Rsm22 family protein [Treponema sp.]MCR5218543.1 hypothetical protein [Treponema sp.]